MRHILFALLFTFSGFAFAQNKNSSGKASSRNASLMESSGAGMDLEGLSVFGAFDLNDQINVSGAGGSTSLTADKGLSLGGIFQFPQFNPGLALQGGGAYELSRTIQNSNGIAISNITAFGELALQMTPQFSLMGGLNYCFPSLSGANNVTIKGKMGYQLGASFKASERFAIDGRYRNLDMQLEAQGGSASAKMTGIILNGRYMF